MSNQANVQSVEALKEFRVALALFAEEALSALGAVNMEAKRTVQWLQHDRRAYWEEQIKRRREQVAQARAEVARRRLAKTSDYTPAHSEQKELLRLAEASLRDAEMRVAMVKKWGPALQQAILEYHATTRRISNLASGDVPRAMAVLGRVIVALEAYLRVAPPSGSGEPPKFESITAPIMAEAESVPLAEDGEPASEPPGDAEPGESSPQVGSEGDHRDATS